ncbi:MAG: GNAT family N-acetyltransferase [Planctomycetota bacterium]
MDTIREHGLTLRDGSLVLRPMTEGDWDLLLRWNNDPEVLCYAEGADVRGRALPEVQALYRGVSKTALCFIMESDGLPLGECWLQRMNLPRILRRFPDRDCRRIDLTIGEKESWGKGIGTRAIRLLARLAFEREEADALFACDVADYNPRSQRAFEKAGFELWETVPQPPGRKARTCHDLMLTRETYLSRVEQRR